MTISKQTVFSNLIWRFLERSGAQTVSFIVAVVLARILSPEDYGTIALITVVINILNVFVNSGLGNALIQKKNADTLDFSTVFYTNIVFCLILYALLFVFSPIIAEFYNDAELVAIIRVLGLTVVISGVKNIQQAYVSKTMQFKKFFFSTLVGTVFAAVVGIAMAYCGFGVWALVAQQLVNTAIDTVILWGTVKWHPTLCFSVTRLKGLFAYGWKLLVSALLESVSTNLRQLIIGRKYSSSDLAFYNKGEQFPQVIVLNINNSIDSVIFPAMANAQDDKERLKSMTRRSIKTSTFCIAPMMMGIAACAPSIVTILLTEKWLFCVPFMRIFCVTYMFYPIHTANLIALNALGRSDLFLVLEIIKKICGFAILFSTMWFGVMVMAYSCLFSDLLGQLINTAPNKKLLGYGYLEQLRDILPGILLAVFMGFLVSAINLLHCADWLKLCMQIPLGGAIFIAGAKFFKLEAFVYMKGIINECFFARRNV